MSVAPATKDIFSSAQSGKELKQALKEEEKALHDIQHSLELVVQELKKVGKVVDQVQVIADTIGDLPEGQMPVEFSAIPVEEVVDAMQANKADLPKVQGVRDGSHHYQEVLTELDRLKDRLGGSPAFGNKKPTLVQEDSRKTFFGTPVSAIKEKFRQILDLGWRPKIFWRPLAKMFGVTVDNKPSQYEDAHIRIQRFGMVAANKELLVSALDSGDTNRYGEIRQIAGLFWHPDDNAPSVEKTQDNFKAQLQKRLLEFPNIQLHVEAYPKSGNLGEPVLFDVNSEITRSFIERI